ncbi:uncharacterized protein CLUP02_08157 [Colletotrichum lupini]|uniref:Uncharacterized protein n=1 Tax=Colletotrichum lupini TaxID=145971 RepID=A0A9Q8SU95_9PEZI|nr:uncharacterized protein CLUP02_08157 [Colletotrichum lupini]UQC82667.1 hypothetical protein CLUP02_08157 [Colletotrichum lupini]
MQYPFGKGNNAGGRRPVHFNLFLPWEVSGGALGLLVEAEEDIGTGRLQSLAGGKISIISLDIGEWLLVGGHRVPLANHTSPKLHGPLPLHQQWGHGPTRNGHHGPGTGDRGWAGNMHPIAMAPAQYASQHTAYHPTQPTQYPVPHCQRLQSYLMVHGYTVKAQALRWHQGDREEKETRNIPPIKSERHREEADKKGMACASPTNVSRFPLQKSLFGYEVRVREQFNSSSARSIGAVGFAHEIMAAHAAQPARPTAIQNPERSRPDMPPGILTLETERSMKDRPPSPNRCLRRRVNGSASAFWRSGIQWNKKYLRNKWANLRRHEPVLATPLLQLFTAHDEPTMVENGREEIKQRKIQAKNRSENATKKFSRHVICEPPTCLTSTLHSPEGCADSFAPSDLKSNHSQSVPTKVRWAALLGAASWLFLTSYRRHPPSRIHHEGAKLYESKQMLASPRSLSPLNTVFHKPNMMFLFLLVAARIRHTVRGTCICIWIPGLGSISWGPFMEFVGPFTLWLPWPAPRAKNQTKLSKGVMGEGKACFQGKKPSERPTQRNNGRAHTRIREGDCQTPSTLTNAYRSLRLILRRWVRSRSGWLTDVEHPHAFEMGGASIWFSLLVHGKPRACSVASVSACWKLGEARRSWDEFRFHRNKHWGNLEPPSLLMPPFPCPVIFLGVTELALHCLTDDGVFLLAQVRVSGGSLNSGTVECAFLPLRHGSERCPSIRTFWYSHQGKIVIRTTASSKTKHGTGMTRSPRLYPGGAVDGLAKTAVNKSRKSARDNNDSIRRKARSLPSRWVFSRARSRDDGQLPFYSSHRILHFYSKRSRTEFHETATSLAYKWPCPILLETLDPVVPTDERPPEDEGIGAAEPCLSTTGRRFGIFILLWRTTFGSKADQPETDNNKPFDGTRSRFSNKLWLEWATVATEKSDDGVSNLICDDGTFI